MGIQYDASRKSTDSGERFKDYEKRYRDDAKSSFQDTPVQDTTKLLSQDKRTTVNIYSTIIPDPQISQDEGKGHGIAPLWPPAQAHVNKI